MQRSLFQNEARMEFSDLVTFATVARHGGITRAASELRTVQSNVTNRIKALEAEVGIPLFERHSRGMTLTGAGRRLLPYVERLTALSREAIVATRDDGVPKGPLALGSMETTAAVRLPSLLAHFHKTCPAVELTLRTGPTAMLVSGVLDGTFDGAFVCGPIDHPDLLALSVFKEELVLVSASRWPSLAALRKAMSDPGPTALVFRAGCSYRQRLEQLLAEFGWPSATRLEFGTLDGIIGCVGADMGVTLLPRMVVERAGSIGSIRAHALGGPHKWVETLFIRRRASREDSAVKSFISCLTSTTAERAACGAASRTR
jgi:DNA-binding transcriptional LysR family regulator